MVAVRLQQLVRVRGFSVHRRLKHTVLTSLYQDIKERELVCVLFFFRELDSGENAVDFLN